MNKFKTLSLALTLALPLSATLASAQTAPMPGAPAQTTPAQTTPATPGQPAPAPGAAPASVAPGAGAPDALANANDVFLRQLAAQLGLSVQQLRAAAVKAGNSTIDQLMKAGHMATGEVQRLRQRLTENPFELAHRPGVGGPEQGKGPRAAMNGPRGPVGGPAGGPAAGAVTAKGGPRMPGAGLPAGQPMGQQMGQPGPGAAAPAAAPAPAQPGAMQPGAMQPGAMQPGAMKSGQPTPPAGQAPAGQSPMGQPGAAAPMPAGAPMGAPAGTAPMPQPGQPGPAGGPQVGAPQAGGPQGGPAQAGMPQPLVPQAVARALGLTETELREQLASGQTVATLARAKGISTASIRQAALNALKSELDTAVKAGRLTQAQAAQELARAQADTSFGLMAAPAPLPAGQTPAAPVAPTQP